MQRDRCRLSERPESRNLAGDIARAGHSSARPDTAARDGGPAAAYRLDISILPLRKHSVNHNRLAQGRGAVRRRAGLPWLTILVAAVLQGCGGDGDGAGAGGGGGVAPPPASGLPDQTGCAYQYTLTSWPALAGADPFLTQQWHLDNTGQSGGTAGEDIRAALAWATTRGVGARIAVVDDAVEVLHQDIEPNVIPGASFSYRTASLGNAYPLPCAADDDHGTAVAGVAAARDGNAVGVSGIASRAGLVGYSALSTRYDADIADALTRGLADNGVYNNSWGSPDDGLINPAEASFVSAIETGLASGRGGRGAIYVFPGGNGGCYALDSSGQCYSESAGLDGYLNHRGVIPVCAVDHFGRQPYYGEPGANLLVCAPSSDESVAITTTGLNSTYRNDFSGTSASVPMVSGVVALMLSVNPNLTWRDVRLILAQTARKNDPADTAGWVASTFGPAFNHKYGFGVVDAGAAVATARTWTSVGGNGTLKSCGPYASTVARTLPDASGANLTTVEDTITVGGDCTVSRIEYVEVVFSASHSYAGDLRIRLVSPNGLVSRLVDERLCDGSGNACGGYSSWPFGSARHLGEPATGAWRLQVTDAQADDAGTWQNWTIRIWGR